MNKHGYAEQVRSTPVEQPSSLAGIRELFAPRSIIPHCYAGLRIMILGTTAAALSLKWIQSHPYVNGADEAWESSELTTTSLLHSLGWMTGLEGSTINSGLIIQFDLLAVT